MATMLQTLIRNRLDNKGWPVSRLIDLGGIKKSTAYRLLNTPLKRMPEDETIAGLAKALEMHEGVIRLTAAQDLGIELHFYEEALADPDLRLVMLSMLELPPDARRYFAEMIDKYRHELVHGRAITFGADGPKVTIEEGTLPPGETHAVVMSIEPRTAAQPASEVRADKKVARKRAPRRKQ